MITDELAGFADPMWIVIDVAEFAIALLFLRGLPWRSDDLRAPWVETALAFAAWHGVHMLHLDFLFDFSLNVAVLVAYTALSRPVNVRQALYFACTFVLCTEIGKVVCVDLVMQPAYGALHGAPTMAVTLVWGAVFLLVTLAASSLARRWVFVAGTERLSWRQCLLALLPLAPYMYIRSSYFYESVEQSTAFYWDFVWMMLILSGCTVVMVVGNASNLSSQLERNELVRMQMLLHEQNAQYLAQRQANEAVRRRYHDLKHYLVEFERMLRADRGGAGEAEGLLADMRAELHVCETDVETGNEVLDVVLAEKAAECQRAGVRAAFYADASCLAFMSAFDVCTVFGNLLDNAIEAARGIAGEAEGGASQGEGRVPEVSLSVRRRKGFVSVRCANPYAGELQPVPDGFVTTKGDGHGIGLRSVRSTVERYGGALTLEASEGLFTATAVIPIPPEADPAPSPLA